jgi:hypothetical protein
VSHPEARPEGEMPPTYPEYIDTFRHVNQNFRLATGIFSPSAAAATPGGKAEFDPSLLLESAVFEAAGSGFSR